MNKDHSDNEVWVRGVNRVREALAKFGLKYDWDGITVIHPIPSPSPDLKELRLPDQETIALHQRRFSVALSFPGEHHQPFIEAVAEQLAETLGRDKLLYDHYHEAEFARPDLDIYLPRLYLEQSELICVFLCQDYAKKRWCNLEWRFIRQLIATAEQSRIMFLSFDEVGAIPELGILPGDGYLPIRNRLPTIIAQKIAERLAQVLSVRKDASPEALRHEAKIVNESSTTLVSLEAQARLMFEDFARLRALIEGYRRSKGEIVAPTTRLMSPTDVGAELARVIDADLLEVMARNVNKAKERLKNAIADPANTQQAKDAEMETAKSTICAELRRILLLNDDRLTGVLEPEWRSFRCQ